MITNTIVSRDNGARLYDIQSFQSASRNSQETESIVSSTNFFESSTLAFSNHAINASAPQQFKVLSLELRKEKDDKIQQIMAILNKINTAEKLNEELGVKLTQLYDDVATVDKKQAAQNRSQEIIAQKELASDKIADRRNNAKEEEAAIFERLKKSRLKSSDKNSRNKAFGENKLNEESFNNSYAQSNLSLIEKGKEQSLENLNESQKANKSREAKSVQQTINAKTFAMRNTEAIQKAIEDKAEKSNQDKKTFDKAFKGNSSLSTKSFGSPISTEKKLAELYKAKVLNTQMIQEERRNVEDFLFYKNEDSNLSFKQKDIPLNKISTLEN